MSTYRLRDIIGRAVSIVQDLNPHPALVGIHAMGLNGEGSVELSTDSFIPRWQFSFYDKWQHRFISVSWLSERYGLASPYVDENAGNIIMTDPLVTHFAEICCSESIAHRMAQEGVGFGGSDDDVLTIIFQEGEDWVVAGSRSAPPENKHEHRRWRVAEFD